MESKQSNPPEKEKQTREAPFWVNGKHIDEVGFCQDFLKEHPMYCMKGCFYTVEGRLSNEEKLARMIYERLKPWVKTGVAAQVDKLIALLRRECYEEEFPLFEDRVMVANGTVFVEGGFMADLHFCRNRLPVQFDPEAPEPVRWMSFLNDLLYEEDIPTLQEYLGYCLIPTNRAQRMLMMVGKGGEGKSRIGAVLRAIFGDNMVANSLGKIETNRFARADLEGALLMVDDDMQMEALPQTNYIKTIVTADAPLDLERKGVQSYQGELYCRFLGFGNGSLKALYDHSEGFYRRQIILTTKPKDPKRQDDPQLTERLLEEKESIFFWCLNGLMRLQRNNYRFTISKRSRDNLRAAYRDANNAAEFMRDRCCVELNPQLQISSKELYRLYRQWCEDNICNPLSARSFVGWLIDNQQTYQISYTTNILLPNHHKVRGFHGVGAAT